MHLKVNIKKSKCYINYQSSYKLKDLDLSCKQDIKKHNCGITIPKDKGNKEHKN